jgi:hypothetical protein
MLYYFKTGIISLQIKHELSHSQKYKNICTFTSLAKPYIQISTSRFFDKYIIKRVFI